MARRLLGVAVLAAGVCVVFLALRPAPQPGGGAPAPFSRDAFPVLTGPYLGQAPPGPDPVRFAPGIVSTSDVDAPPAFSSDGREVFWARIGRSRGLLSSRLENDRWTFPERASFAGSGFVDVAPCFFDGGRRLLFLSTRPLPDGRRPQRGFFTFWVTQRDAAGWSQPRSIDSFYSGVDDFSTIADDGTLYIVRSKGERGIERVAPEADGRYHGPVALSPEIKAFPTLVGPGGRYLVVSAQLPGGYGERDLYVLFARADGSWSAPVNMGPRVNSPAIEALASVSPDGKYFFFASERSGNFDVYWMEAGIIEELRAKVRI